MSEKPLLPVYLLTGGDRPKIEVALQRLRRHFVPESIELTTAQETDGPTAVALCNAGGLFGDARLVVVAGADKWKAADLKAVEAYIADPAPKTVLALVAEELKKDAALRKA